MYEIATNNFVVIESACSDEAFKIHEISLLVHLPVLSFGNGKLG